MVAGRALPATRQRHKKRRTKPIEISRKSLALKELTSDVFGLLYAEQTQFPGRGGRDTGGLAMPEAGTWTGLAHAGSGNRPGSRLPMRWSLLECQDVAQGNLPQARLELGATRRECIGDPSPGGLEIQGQSAVKIEIDQSTAKLMIVSHDPDHVAEVLAPVSPWVVQHSRAEGHDVLVPDVQPPDEVACQLRAIDRLTAPKDRQRCRSGAQVGGKALLVHVDVQTDPDDDSLMTPSTLAVRTSEVRGSERALDQNAGDLAALNANVVGPLDASIATGPVGHELRGRHRRQGC